MTRRVDFDAAVRRGRRAGRARLVAHAYPAAPPAPAESSAAAPAASARVASAPAASALAPSEVEHPDCAVLPGPSPKVGFVVSRAVGNAVVRNRVARRLRHLMRPRLAQLPPGTLLVVRALPPAAAATSAELAADLDGVLRRLRLVTAP